MSLISSIQFSASILDKNHKPANNYSVTIQYFIVDAMQWVVLGKPSTSKDGKVMLTYKIPEKIARTDKTAKNIKTSINSGSLPMFRIVKTNTKTKINYVLSYNTSIISSENNIVIHLDFGNLILLDKKNWIQLKTAKSILIASVISNKTIKEIITPKIDITMLEKKGFVSEKKAKDLEKSLENVTKEKLKTVKSLSLKKVELDGLKNEKRVLENKNLQLATDLSKTKESLKQVSFTNESLQKTINKNNKIIDNLNKENASNKSKTFELEKTISELIKDKLDLELLLDKKKLEPKIYTPKAISANKLYTNIIKDVKIADSSAVSSGYKLEGFKLNLKTVVEHDEDGIRFQPIDISKANKINGSAISDVLIDLTKEPAKIVKNKLTPNVIGLTETAVRKLLLEYDLKLDSIYQSINSETSNLIIGQSFKQLPEAGDEFDASKIVTVIFAKENKN